MNVYVSCHVPKPANKLALALIMAGHKIVSTWHTSDEPRPAPDDAAGWGANAERNMAELATANVYVLIASPGHLDGSHRIPGGKFVEAGWALQGRSPGDRLFTAGGVENGMLYHPPFEHVQDAAELIAKLGEPK